MRRKGLNLVNVLRSYVAALSIGVVLTEFAAGQTRPTVTGTISAAECEADGVLVHRVTSGLQSGPTEIRVLLPQGPLRGSRRRVVYLLPVEAGREARFGDGLDVVRRMNGAERFGVIVVAPTFARLPWYADHPTDPTLRQESYLVQCVVPLVDHVYPTIRAPAGRLLCGFSKSGWGAWSLVLRHPNVFGRAASWDAPLMMDAPGKYGSGPIFGTVENFRKYEITRLVEETSASGASRLILLGHGNFTDDRPLHALLERREVPHVYRPGRKSEHIWSAEWLEPALTELTK